MRILLLPLLVLISALSSAYSASIPIFALNSTVNLNPGSSLEFRIDSQGNLGQMAINSEGSLNLSTEGIGVTLTIVAPGYTAQAGDLFTPFSGVTSNITGDFSSYSLPPLPSGLIWDTSQLHAAGNWLLMVIEGEAPPLRYYMAPDGNDANTGTSPSAPVKTIARVQTLLQAHNPQGDVEIIIQPGTYHGQTVIWTYYHPEYKITFRPPHSTLDRPVFDGMLENGTQPGGTWLRLNASAGESSNLHFYRIHFQNYHTALSFNGNRDFENRYNGNNRIEECYFYRIGNVFNPSLETSTAVIRFVNSKNNLVLNNDFVDAVNVTGGTLLHAIYAAHLSDFNTISQNRFINHSGDPVRIRDYSNWNYISDNIHIRAGFYGYSEWYCNHDERDDCTKPAPECPSWGNEFRNNILVSNYNGGSLSTFTFFQPDSTTGCLPPNDTAVRLRTSGNIHLPNNSAFGPYQFWLHANFTPQERAQPDISGPEATPANDGIPNAIKLALGLDPKKYYSSSDIARPGIHNGRPTLTFSRNLNISGLDPVIQVSEDLVHWREATTDDVEILLIEANAEDNLERVTLSLRNSDNNKRFLRYVINHSGLQNAWNPWQN